MQPDKDESGIPPSKEANKGKLVLHLGLTDNSLKFMRELETTYFPLGTSSNKDFEIAFDLSGGLFVAIPDTPINRSAISILGHKYGLRFSPLTKFDEYMNLAHEVRNAEDNGRFRQKMFDDVFKYVSDHYDLGNVKSVSMLYLDKERWRSLTRLFPGGEFASTASSLRDCSIDEKATIRPSKGSHIIFFRAETFMKMTTQDFVYNFLLTVAHELIHFAGILDEIKVHLLEFDFAEKFLGIYFTEQQKKDMIRDLKARIKGGGLKK